MEPERVEVPRKEVELPWDPKIEDYRSSQTSSEGAQKENREIESNEHMQQEKPSSSQPSSGGLVIVDKLYEPLDAARKAFGSRITETMILPKKLQEYPNPIEEKKRLASYQWLVQDIQTIWEGPLTKMKRGPISKKPALDTILEVSSTLERASTILHELDGTKEKCEAKETGKGPLEELEMIP